MQRYLNTRKNTAESDKLHKSFYLLNNNKVNKCKHQILYEIFIIVRCNIYLATSKDHSRMWLFKMDYNTC